MVALAGLRLFESLPIGFGKFVNIMFCEFRINKFEGFFSNPCSPSFFFDASRTFILSSIGKHKFFKTKVIEGVIHNGMNGFGHVTFAPKRFAEPKPTIFGFTVSP